MKRLNSRNPFQKCDYIREAIWESHELIQITQIFPSPPIKWTSIYARTLNPYTAAPLLAGTKTFVATTNYGALTVKTRYKVINERPAP